MSQLHTHWIWWILAVGLVCLEMVVPGTFLLWFGLAAGLIGLVAYYFPEISLVWQLFGFTLTSALMLIVCFRYFRHPIVENTLNRKSAQLIDQTCLTETAIKHGMGMVRIGDSVWSAKGSDLPAGRLVKVVAVEGNTLVVIAVD